MADEPFSLKAAATVARSKDWRWYVSPVGDRLTPDARRLLEEYSQVPADDVEAHVTRCRDQAWEVFPFPCIGEYWFLNFGLAAHPHYPQLLQQLRAHPETRLIDLGTCLGQDLRRLVYDGAPGANLYGADLLPGFEDAGYALFCDRLSYQGHFIAADIFDPESTLAKTEGTWNVITTFMFLHMFNLRDAQRACRRLLRMLAREGKGYVLGTQTGSLNPKVFPLGPPFVENKGDKTVYRHSRETFIQMWEDAARDEGMRVDIWAAYQVVEDPEAPGGGGKTMFGGDDNRRIHFKISTL